MKKLLCMLIICFFTFSLSACGGVSVSNKMYNEISDYAKNSVVSLNYNKIIAGDEKGYFNPKNNATRAEVCKMIYNSLNREGGK